jgi:hypothetical protein
MKYQSITLICGSALIPASDQIYEEVHKEAEDDDW